LLVHNTIRCSCLYALTVVFAFAFSVALALAFALAPLHVRLRLRFHSYLRLHVRWRCETLGSHGLVKDRTCSHSGVRPIGPSYGVMLPCFECVAIVWHRSSLTLRRPALLCSGWLVQCCTQSVLYSVSVALSWWCTPLYFHFAELCATYDVITKSLTTERSGSHL
jgi:hypothetical protein